VAAHVAEHGLAGWYFRVLTAGECEVGDALIHVERLPGAVSLARFNRSLREARPSLQILDMLASAPGLTPDWVRKIRSRIDWLQNNKDAV
jgi:MOSC domain-containing protein YiiM